MTVDTRVPRIGRAITTRTRIQPNEEWAKRGIVVYGDWEKWKADWQTYLVRKVMKNEPGQNLNEDSDAVRKEAIAAFTKMVQSAPLTTEYRRNSPLPRQTVSHKNNPADNPS